MIVETNPEMIAQRTAAWFEARLGRATASNFKHVMARLKNGSPAAARQDYLMDLVTERMTGRPTEHYVNSYMLWGTENEPFARQIYEQRTGYLVDEVGFITHPELAAGASPDGIIEIEGCLEIKCPSTKTHITTLQNGMDPSHLPQVQGQLWITGCQWADFVSYDPRMPEGLTLYVQRITRDDAYISKLEAEVRAFLDEVDAVIATLKEKAQ